MLNGPRSKSRRIAMGCATTRHSAPPVDPPAVCRVSTVDCRVRCGPSALSCAAPCGADGADGCGLRLSVCALTRALCAERRRAATTVTGRDARGASASPDPA